MWLLQVILGNIVWNLLRRCGKSMWRHAGPILVIALLWMVNLILKGLGKTETVEKIREIISGIKDGKSKGS